MQVYQNVCIVTVNDTFEVIECGCVATKGSEIVYVGENREFPGATVRDCTVMVLMPGFVNGHTHTPMTLFRGWADNLSLHDWLNTKIFPLEGLHTDETLHRGTMLAAAELIRCGVTTINDMYYDGRITAKVLKQVGLSGIVSSCLIGVAGEESVAKQMDITLETAARYAGDADIRVAVAPHAEYTATAAQLTRWGQTAADHKLPIHVHCSETKSEHLECVERHGCTPVELFHRLGFFQVPTLLAHCVHIDEADMGRIVEGGASVLHNPCSNLKLASGVAPIPRMLERGLSVALSTDGSASNNTQDMWEEMRFVALIHKGVTGDATVVNSQQALHMATRGAAKALGYTDRGSIQVGQRADFILFQLQAPSMRPVTDITNLIVYSGNSRDIQITVAGGQVVYENGIYRTLDIQQVYRDAQQSFDQVFRGH